MLLLKLFHFLQVEIFLKLISISFPSCRLTQVNLLQNFIHFQIRKRHVQKQKLNFISFHLFEGGDHILRLDENNWQCLWCTKVFQVINATKALDHVLWNKGMRIKSCYFPKDKAHITRYQELQNFKQAQKVVLFDYSEKMKASISSLHNKSSGAIESTMHHSYKIITLSNDTNISEMLGLSSASNITTERNSRNVSNGSLLFLY